MHDGPGFAEAAAAQEDNSLVGSGGAPAAKAKPGARATASAVSAMSFVGKVQSTGEGGIMLSPVLDVRGHQRKRVRGYDGHTGVLVDSGGDVIVLVRMNNYSPQFVELGGSFKWVVSFSGMMRVHGYSCRTNRSEFAWRS